MAHHEVDKHFAATTYIFDKNRPRTLLHFHPKLSTWLPPGGHVEKNEHPYEAAVREIIEETGLEQDQLEFILKKDFEDPNLDERSVNLPMPTFLISEEIEKEKHYHLDFIFYAFIEGEELIETKEIKENGFQWFEKEEIENEVQMFENVRILALKGFNTHY